MKDLLLAIRDALDATGQFERVYLTEVLGEEVDLAPRDMRLPAAGVADGEEDAALDGTAGSLTRRLTARVAVYVSLQTRREVGENLLTLLELVETVKTTLHRNLLGLTGLVLAHYQGANAASVVEWPSGLALRKIVTISYEREE